MKANSLLSLILAVALVIVCGRMAFSGSDKNKNEVKADTTVNVALQNIMTRASVRAYKAQPVEDAKITALLKAGMAAPTAADKRPWRFVAVTDKDQLTALSEVNPHAQLISKAPLVIVVCGDMRKTMDGEGRDNWILDTSAASENILLAAHALGLGAVWTGVYPVKDRVKGISEVLELPEEVVPLSAIAIGYPAQKVTPKNKWDEDNVSYDAYDE
ncbi:MAG: nitroreductase family protein [Prevotella sp.]|nr:nitroreductase family protein [Prevotella sp.]